MAQGDANKAVPDIQKAIQNSSADDAAVMQEVLDRARAQVPVVALLSGTHITMRGVLPPHLMVPFHEDGVHGVSCHKVHRGCDPS